MDRQFAFTLERNALNGQFTSKCFLVDVLEEAMAQMGVTSIAAPINSANVSGLPGPPYTMLGFTS